MGPKQIHTYYESFESKFGYKWLLGGRKHFGYYPDQGEKHLSYRQSMDNMETKLIEALGQKQGARILDAGCGMGRVATHLAKRESLSIVGIDILSWNLVEARSYARKHSPQNMPEFIEASYEQLPFDDNSFDAIYTMETFVHAENPAKVLAEFKRVLKPGGRLVQFEYENQNHLLKAKSRQLLESVIVDSYMPALLHFKFGRIKELHQSAGLVEAQDTDITHNIIPMLKSFYRLAYLPYYLAKLFKLRQERYVNVRAAVEFYRTRMAWRYVIVASSKGD